MSRYPFIKIVMMVLLMGCSGETLNSGAPQGNADGYHGIIGTAYLMNPDATCMVDGEEVTVGYDKRIEALADGSLIMIDPCTEIEQAVDVAQVETLNKQLIGYRTDVYEIRDTPPDPQVDEIYHVAWCGARYQPPGTKAGFLIRSTTLTHKPSVVIYSVQNQNYVERDRLPVRVIYNTEWRFLFGEGFSSTIYITPLSMKMNLYAGSARWEDENYDILCRLIPKHLRQTEEQ